MKYIDLSTFKQHEIVATSLEDLQEKLGFALNGGAPVEVEKAIEKEAEQPICDCIACEAERSGVPAEVIQMVIDLGLEITGFDTEEGVLYVGPAGVPNEAPVPDVPLDFMTFGDAIEALKQGYYVRRRGWNGKGMWLHLQVPDAGSKMSLPYIYMKTADEQLVPWLASQTDMLSEDWELAGV